MGCSRNRSFVRGIPNTIRDLLKMLIERDVTIILNAEDEPEHVEIEAVCGDLLVAETECHKIKFVDINCICAVIVDREELLEGLFTECEEPLAGVAERREDERAAAARQENEGSRYTTARRRSET